MYSYQYTIYHLAGTLKHVIDEGRLEADSKSDARRLARDEYNALVRGSRYFTQNQKIQIAITKLGE